MIQHEPTGDGSTCGGRGSVRTTLGRPTAARGSATRTVCRATPHEAASRLAPLNLIEVDTTLDHFVQRREISQATHLGDHARRRVIDLLFRSCATQTKTNRAMGS